MTKKEALDWLVSRKEHYEMDDNCQELAEAIGVGIDAIEQELCDDCISRQAVLDLLVKYDNDMKFDVYSEIFDNIDKLPPVNPDKTGHWIDDGQYAEGHSEHVYRCSECGKTYTD